MLGETRFAGVYNSALTFQLLWSIRHFLMVALPLMLEEAQCAAKLMQLYRTPQQLPRETSSKACLSTNRLSTCCFSLQALPHGSAAADAGGGAVCRRVHGAVPHPRAAGSVRAAPAAADAQGEPFRIMLYNCNTHTEKRVRLTPEQPAASAPRPQQPSRSVGRLPPSNSPDDDGFKGVRVWQ